jgi:hypothetical protein
MNSGVQPIVDGEEHKKGLQTEIYNPLILRVRVGIKPTCDACVLTGRAV